MLDWLSGLLGPQVILTTAARYVLVALGTTLATKGLVDQSVWEAAIPGFIAGCTALYGAFKNTDAQLIKRTSRLPSVTKVVLHPAQPKVDRQRLGKGASRPPLAPPPNDSWKANF